MLDKLPEDILNIIFSFNIDKRITAKEYIYCRNNFCITYSSNIDINKYLFNIFLKISNVYIEKIIKNMLKYSTDYYIMDDNCGYKMSCPCKVEIKTNTISGLFYFCVHELNKNKKQKC